MTHFIISDNNPHFMAVSHNTDFIPHNTMIISDFGAYGAKIKDYVGLCDALNSIQCLGTVVHFDNRKIGGSLGPWIIRSINLFPGHYSIYETFNPESQRKRLILAYVCPRPEDQMDMEVGMRMTGIFNQQKARFGFP